MPNINDIDDMIEKDPEREKPLEENYDIKKSTFRLDKPKVEQFFSKKKILIVFGVIGILSVVLVLTIRSAKHEKIESEKSTLAARNTFDVTEEISEKSTKTNIPEDAAALQNTENTGMPETTTLEQYESMLGPQYENNESFSTEETVSDSNTYSDEAVGTENRKKYGKSPINFKSKTEVVTTGTTSPEQQMIIPQQTQETRNQVTDTTQNRQESKQKFVETQRSKSFYSRNTVVPPMAKYELKAGTMIPAVLITAINSDLPGEIIAQVTSDVHDFATLKHILIPMGSRIIGRYDSNVTYGQNRLLIVWDRIIFPNGNTLVLDNYQGVDLLGNSGMKGKVNNHFWKLLRSVILSAGINMAAGRLESLNVNVGNSSRVSIGRGTSDAAGNIETIGSRMVEKDLNQQPTIKIKRGSRFNIFVNSDMALPVYSGRN